MKNKQLTHHQMKEALHRNELVSWLTTASEWTKAHLENVLIVGVAVVVLIFGGLYWFSSQAEKRVDASRQLEEAQTVLAQVDSRSAAETAQIASQAYAKFQAIVAGGTPQSAVARLGMAAASFAMGRFDDARKDYEAFLGAEGDKHVLAPLAALGVATCLEALGKSAEANTQYLGVAKRFPDSGHGAQALWQNVEMQQRLGVDSAQRTQLLQAIRERGANGGYVGELKLKVDQALGGSVPKKP